MFYWQRSIGGLLAVVLLHACDEVKHLVGVADLVVIPANNLNEGGGELDTGVLVEDRGADVAEEVAGNYCVFGVSEDAFEFAFGSLLHSGADFVVGSGLGEVYGEVNNRYVEGGDTHRPWRWGRDSWWCRMRWIRTAGQRRCCR